MADYYPLLAKALANLPTRTAPTARRAIYERARKALIGQLRSIQPPMAEVDIATEDAALDVAIARLESEYGGQRGSAAAPPPPPAAPPPVAREKSPPPPLAPARAAPAVRPAPAPPPSPAGPPAASVPVPTSPPSRVPLAAPAPRRPAIGPPPVAAPSTARAAPAIEPDRAPAGGFSAASAPPLAADPRVAPADARDLAPRVAASPPAASGVPPTRAGDDGRPSAPGRAQLPSRNPWPLVALVALLAIAGGIAVAAYFWKEPPPDPATKTTAESIDANAQASQAKIARRIGPADPGEPAPPPVETPIPTVPVPVTPVPAPPAPIAPAPQHLAENPPANLAPAASRAAMLIGVSSDPQKPLVNLGTAVWSTIAAVSGQPSTLAVRVEIEIPDQKMHVTVTIRKNADPSLPATHTIDLRATFADGAEIKGIQDMGLPQLRKQDATLGDVVSGVRVKISDSYYLVGLTRSDTDAAHNLTLLATRSWMDFPLLLNDDRIAKLTFDKGEAGDRVMAQALDAWK